MKPIKVGLLGLGTVGSATVAVLRRNAEEIARRAGRGIEIKSAAVRNLTRARQIAGIEICDDPYSLVNDPELGLIVELIGGNEPAKSLVLQALENGKHVVTANKALIAEHGNEIFSVAHQQGRIVAFEGAVAGGIPIIKLIREGFAGNSILGLAGIINGTANYILTAMRDHGQDFSEVLAEAQALGYAEADPSFDVEGIDAAHKLTILASIAFGIPLQYSKVYTEGITGVTRADVAYALELGYEIKHLGIARRVHDRFELRVHPALVPERRPLAKVDGVMNAILVTGDAVGQTMAYGAGAGGEPTASAVVADIVDVVRTLTADPGNRVPHLAFQAETLLATPIASIDEVETAFYLRLEAVDQPGVMADISRVMGERHISLEGILQKEPKGPASTVPLVLITHRVLGATMRDAVNVLEQLPTVTGPVTNIRIETLD